MIKNETKDLIKAQHENNSIIQKKIEKNDYDNALLNQLKKRGGSLTKSRKHDFLLSAKNLYLEYPNCNLSLVNILILLKEKLSSYKIINWIIVRTYNFNRIAKILLYLKTEKKTQIISPTFLHLQYGKSLYEGVYNSGPKANYLIETMLDTIESVEDPNLYCSKEMMNIVEKHLKIKNFQIK